MNITINSILDFKRKKIIILTFIILVVGFFTFLSATITFLSNPVLFKKIFLNQLIAISIGIIGFLIIQKMNYVKIKNRSFWFFLLILLIQISLLIPGIGFEINNSVRWIKLGFFTIQPSEFFRLGTILFFGNLFVIFNKEIGNFKTFLIYFLPFISLTFLFYYYIHDFGSFMILLATILTMLLFTKLKKIKFLLLTITLLSISFYLIWNHSIHGHQRILTYYNTLFYPEKLDKKKEFYHLHNMLVSVGSGQLNGVGYGGSYQKFKKKLPESISDSIFSIFAEEWGFIFSSLLIMLYFWLSYEIFSSIFYLKNLYKKIIIAGLGMNVLFPAFYNIGTVIGLVPLSGIPLTFISKGGSSIIASIISIGFIVLFLKKK